jgi:hypothetical protein
LLPFAGLDFPFSVFVVAALGVVGCWVYYGKIRVSFISPQDHARNRFIHALYARCKGTRVGL